MTTTELLSRLVAYPTVSNRSNLELIDFIKGYLEDQGISANLVRDEKEAKAALHCRIGPPVDGGVILSGHTDVVPVEGQPWDTDPFILTERDGKLYGRGSADMKGFLACCLSCLREMTEADLKRPIYFAFSYDEEVSCQAAPVLVENIKKTYEESPKYAIIGEPSRLQPILGQKGISMLRTTITGSQGHSSRIRQEVSAIHVAARLIGWIEDRIEVLIRTGRLDKRFDPPHSTLHVGAIKGGVAANIIANSCTFDWDLRVIPQDKPEDILADFRSFCRDQEQMLRKRFPGAAIHTESLFPSVPALDTPEESPAADLIRQLTGTGNYSTVAYASEAGQFAEGGFEAVICGPGSIEQAHRANEFISVEQLERGTEFVRKVVGYCEV